MKILVISDLHLNHKFDNNKFNFLKSLILNSDKVIINGDFWSNFTCTFTQFVSSKWSELFPFFLSKNAIYIFGNHDLIKWTDEKVNLFSSEQYQKYEFSDGNNIFSVEHGHLLLPIQCMDNNSIAKIHRILHFDLLFRYPLEKIILRIGGLKLYKMLSYSIDVSLIKKLNQPKNNAYTIFGHSHHANFLPSKNYINTGFINFGYAQYLMITDGVPELFSKRY
jgi:predicted phosphodiesterase